MDVEGYCYIWSHSVTLALGRISLDEGSAHRRDLYVTTLGTHKTQTSMPQAGFEPAISASERPQTYPWNLWPPGSARCTDTNIKRNCAFCNRSTFEIFWLTVTRWIVFSMEQYVCNVQYQELYFGDTWLKSEVICLLGTRAYTDRWALTEMTVFSDTGIVNH